MCRSITLIFLWQKKAVLFNFNSILFKSNILHILCYLLPFFEMLSCDYAVCFEIFDDWNLFKLITDGILMIFLYMRFKCTHKAHLSWNLALLSSFSKPWLCFKSFIFSFLKWGAHYMQEENKIDSYFWNFDEKCLFSTIRTVLSQNFSSSVFYEWWHQNLMQ